MADLFSLAGGAMIQLSTSIKICERLVWYVNNVKDANKKTEYLLAEIERLANVLGLLEKCIGRLDPGEQTNATQSIINACTSAISVFRKKLGADNPLHGSKVRISAAKLTSRLVFPFKHSEILHIKDSVLGILQILQLALEAVHIEQQRVALEKLQLQIKLQIGTTQTTSHSILNQLQVQQDFNTAQTASQTQLIQSCSVSTAQNLDSLRTEIQDVHAMVGVVAGEVSYLNILPRLSTALERIEGRLGPANLEMGNCQYSHRILPVQTINGAISGRSKRNHCTCRSQRIPDKYLPWPVVYSRMSKVLHENSCPRALHNIGARELYLGLNTDSEKLGLGARFAVSILYDTGYIKLRPSLVCYRIVAETSPGFSFVKEITVWRGRTYSHDWASAAQHLHGMFQARHASPHDRLANGMTLLHYLFSRLSYLPHTSNAQCVILIQHLWDYFSSELLEKDDHGYTCVDYLLSYGRTLNGTGWVPLAAELLGNGLQVSLELHLKICNNFFLLWSLNDYTNYAEPFLTCSEGVHMVLSKSESGLQKVIEDDRSDGVLRTEDILTLHRLAISVGWEEGCNLLLSSGLRVAPRVSNDDFDGVPLLEHALDSPKLSIVKFWLEKRALLDEDELEYVGEVEYAFQTVSAFNLLFHERSDLTAIILTSIIEQRRQLQALVTTDLDSCRCWEADGRLLDAHVGCVLHFLSQQGIPVHPSLLPSRGSIYYWDVYSPYPGIETLDMMYDAGFQDVTTADFNCANQISISPLLYMITEVNWAGLPYMMDLVQWFIVKGASLDENWPNSQVSAAHCLGWATGRMTRYDVHDDIFKSSGVSLHFSSDRFDTCDCGCSSFGCAFMHTFWKGLQYDLEFSDKDRPTWFDAQLMRSEPKRLDRMLWLVTQATALPECRWIVTEFIRLYTFSKLGLRHTCCDIERIEHEGKPDLSVSPTPRYPPNQTKRIKEEDAHLLGVLEYLTSDFDSRYETFENDLQAFVDEVLSSEIEAVLLRLRDEDESMYAAGRRDIGVIMEPQSQLGPGKVEHERTEVSDDGGEEIEDEEVW